MRALVLVTACLVLTSAAVSFLACSSDNPAAAGGDGGGGGGTSGDQGTSGGSSGNGTSGGPSGPGETADAGDGGPKRAPNGCILYGTGLKSGAKAENVARTDISGAVNWTNPEGALKEDSQTATFTISDGQQTAQLKVSDFGLTFPSDKVETWGFVVELIRQTQTAGGVLQTANINVEIAGKPTQFKFDNADFYWPTKIMGTHPYGQETDTWMADIDPSDFTPAAFAATLEVQKSPDGGAPGPITGAVDSLRVEIWYATGDQDHCQK